MVKYISQNPIYTGKIRGVLSQSNHYLIEETNVEKLIDSSTFIMVQKRLEFETTGRKRKDVARNPFYNLCYDYGSYFKKRQSIICKVCGLNTRALDLTTVSNWTGHSTVNMTARFYIQTT